MGKVKTVVVWSLVAVLLTAAVLLGLRFLLGGDEDTWICVGGEWVKHGNPRAVKPTAPCAQIKVTTSAWGNGYVIPKKYTCDGENISPPVAVEGMPEKAGSWMLVMHDPDAPLGDFTHWVMWNISPQVTEIPEGKLLEGAVLGKNDFGKIGYNGPCPPSGRHRYFIRVLVFDQYLKATQGASLKEVETEVDGHTVGEGQWEGVYR